MLTDFYEGETKDFDVYVSSLGILQDISLNTVSIIFKEKKDDLDENAVISQTAFECTNRGVAKFKLTKEQTAITPRNYYYEIKMIEDTNLYILESGTVRILDRVYDV